MELLKINNIDFSEQVVQRSYSVQRTDEYDGWFDGNWIERRNVARQRVTGSFTITFSTKQQYDDFLAAIAAVKTTGGYCSGVVMWIDNANSLGLLDVFLDFPTRHVWTTKNFGETPELASVAVKVRER